MFMFPLNNLARKGLVNIYRSVVLHLYGGSCAVVRQSLLVIYIIDTDICFNTLILWLTLQAWHGVQIFYFSSQNFTYVSVQFT